MKPHGSAVVLLVTALLLGGCSMESDRLRATDRDDEIDAVAAELYTAVGVEPDDRVLHAYERSTNQGCAVTLGVEEGFGEGEQEFVSGPRLRLSDRFDPATPGAG